jgi:peptidyl-prolyl cis-trans isomerase SurA
MPHRRLNQPLRRGLARALLAATLLAPAVAQAQVVVLANGSPITELDIAQRSKLIAASKHKTPSRQDVINELIDDRIKISKAKTYGLEVSDKDVEDAFNGMATRQHISVQQFSQALEHSGIAPSALKARLRAELTWNQLVRGKFGSSLQVSEGDLTNVIVTSGDGKDKGVGYVYTLYPVLIVAPRGSAEGVLQAKRQEAENLRGRFTSCTQGLALARSLRDVAVREPVTRSSADLPQQFRDLLTKMEVGHLTAPEMTAQGIQMFALCERKVSNTESAAKKQAREQIFEQRFQAESKKYLDEIRRQSMIEYRHR